MTWNYRVLRTIEEGNGEPVFALHEVYYDEGGKPTGWTGPVHLDGYESVQALVEAMHLMLTDIERHAVFSVQGEYDSPS